MHSTRHERLCQRARVDKNKRAQQLRNQETTDAEIASRQQAFPHDVFGAVLRQLNLEPQQRKHSIAMSVEYHPHNHPAAQSDLEETCVRNGQLVVATRLLRELERPFPCTLWKPRPEIECDNCTDTSASTTRPWGENA